jgi:Na+-transporting methylmalonyl-CoA/oxaloacetate decarboxylase gamma subunit
MDILTEEQKIGFLSIIDKKMDVVQTHVTYVTYSLMAIVIAFLILICYVMSSNDNMINKNSLTKKNNTKHKKVHTNTKYDIYSDMSSDMSSDEDTYIVPNKKRKSYRKSYRKRSSPLHTRMYT